MLCRGPARYLLDPLRWRLPRQSLALDVGSGQKPMWRADVLVDRYLDDDRHRPGRLCTSRPMVCADVCCLPFEDDAFDFVYCSHVLEHVSDPAAAGRELARVGSSGIVATPSYSWEREHDIHDHRWICRMNAGVLEPTPKPSDPSAIPCGDDRDEVVYKWRRTLRMEIAAMLPGPRRRLEDNDAGPERTSAHGLRHEARRAMVGMGSLMHRALSAHGRVDLLSLLRCVECRGRLGHDDGDGALVCLRCGRRYEVRGGIPVMLREG